MAIGKCASACMPFDPVTALNGAEVWRKLTLPTNSKRLHQRNALRDKVQQPKFSPTMAGIMSYVEQHEKDVQLWLAADGPACNQEDEQAQLLKILPVSRSMEMGNEN